MRLWSIHPKYLDSKGLVALWRESLLAKRVLEGKTFGYKQHPQLERFRHNSMSLINSYLLYVNEEAKERGYNFDRSKIGKLGREKITVTEGQILYEFQHLKNKLKIRNSEKYEALLKVHIVESHPVFTILKGPVEKWEITQIHH